MKKSALELQPHRIGGKDAYPQPPCDHPHESTVTGQLHRRDRFQTGLAQDRLGRLLGP